MNRTYIDDLIKMIHEPPICPECGSFLEKSCVAWLCPECGYFDLDMEAFDEVDEEALEWPLNCA